MYYIYVLKSQKDGKLYKGFTKDIDNRLSDHQSGRVRATKNRRPLNLVYTEKYIKREEALIREKYLKTLIGGKELAKILNNL